jgi:hypothetical protein
LFSLIATVTGLQKLNFTLGATTKGRDRLPLIDKLPQDNLSPIPIGQGNLAQGKPLMHNPQGDPTANFREVYLYLRKIDLYNFHSSLIFLMLFFSAFILYPQLPLLFPTNNLYW